MDSSESIDAGEEGYMITFLETGSPELPLAASADME
jgi:hypothetical protein